MNVKVHISDRKERKQSHHIDNNIPVYEVHTLWVNHVPGFTMKHIQGIQLRKLDVVEVLLAFKLLHLVHCNIPAMKWISTLSIAYKIYN
jgi:hypothetical protein